MKFWASMALSAPEHYRPSARAAGEAGPHGIRPGRHLLPALFLSRTRTPAGRCAELAAGDRMVARGLGHDQRDGRADLGSAVRHVGVHCSPAARAVYGGEAGGSARGFRRTAGPTSGSGPAGCARSSRRPRRGVRQPGKECWMRGSTRHATPWSGAPGAAARPRGGARGRLRARAVEHHGHHSYCGPLQIQLGADVAGARSWVRCPFKGGVASRRSAWPPRARERVPVEDSDRDVNMFEKQRQDAGRA